MRCFGKVEQELLVMALARTKHARQYLPIRCLYVAYAKNQQMHRYLVDACSLQCQHDLRCADSKRGSLRPRAPALFVYGLQDPIIGWDLTSA